MHVNGDPLVIAVRASGYLNIFKRLPLLNSRYRQVHTSGNYLIDFFRQRVQEYKKEMMKEDESSWLESESTNFVHAYFQEKQRKDVAGVDHFFTEDQLVSMLFDLWVAGQVRF
jgi:hypothetical protein